MKSSIFVILLLTTISSILPSEEIVVMFNKDYYPFEFINDEGNPEGFTIDLIYAVAREAALTIELVEKSWKDKDELLFNGIVDLAPLYPDEKDNQSIINSDILFSVNFSLLFREGSGFSEKTDLNEKIQILSSGDSAISAISRSHAPGKQIKTKSWSDSLKALSSGYGDYTIISTFHKDLPNENITEDIQVMNSFKLSLPYEFYAAKWNKNLINSINNGISIVKASGEFDSIYKKWFGNKENLITKRSDQCSSIIIYIITTIFLMVAILFYLGKRKVKK